MAEKIIFTVRVYGKAHESRASELAHISSACEQAAHDARGAGGSQRAGLVLADGAVEIAEWEYSPVASA
jgi:hypothetical protein